MPIAVASGWRARGTTKRPSPARLSLCDCRSTDPIMKAIERERLDWTIVVIIILVIGFVCVIVAGQLAARFSPSWQLNTDMESQIDPNSTFVAWKPSGFIEPVDPAILTQPGWINEFLTPGVSIVTGTPFPTLRATPTSSPAPTIDKIGRAHV